MAVDPAIIAGVVMGAGALGWKVWDYVDEKRKTKRLKLKPNPDRCDEHQRHLEKVDADLVTIKTDMATVKADVKNLQKCSDEIKDDLTELRKGR